ncbi:hypothetical protein [Flavobacterium sp. GSB-24]|uniref:hypothetical protein n=1 Tax=Flavobacterium sp. GSB-24 TaxID=2994319 RepID=UPI00248FF3C5|nr:hypothetical protein [Flavobacterium sp. GSB-24]BDU24253.1 hypothetical protein FLGSB24_09970 [Flavobacterium sp. GSB-24]
MKKIVFLIFCISNIVTAQVSSYNKGLKKNTVVIDSWFLNKGVETFATKQNPIGYKESYDELKNALSHFNLNIMEPEVDESLIDGTVQSLRDFQNLSNSFKIEWSKINMVWRAENYQINWICGDELNVILIQKIGK